MPASLRCSAHGRPPNTRATPRGDVCDRHRDHPAGAGAASDRTPAAAPRQPVPPGSDTADVLAELRLVPDEINELRAAGTIR